MYLKKSLTYIDSLTKFQRLSITILFLFATQTSSICQIAPTDILQNGYAVFTCYARSSTDAALAIIDLGQAGTLHDNTANWGSVDVSASFPKPTMYTLSDFDDKQVMSAAIDKAGNIYVGTSTVYRAFPAEGFVGVMDVYKISRNGNSIVLFATLPGNNGGGWLDIDETHNQLYVSNFDDGMIYTIPINAGPNIPATFAYNTFAPHASQGLNDDVAPLGNRIWSVGYNEVESRLYYSIWARDVDVTTGLDNTIRSVAIDANGNFVPGSDVLEITQPNEDLWFDGPIVNTSTPVSDIEFNLAGNKMLIAEQSYNSVIPVGEAHASRLLEANGGTGNWVLEAVDKHGIGIISGYEENARGGIDFLYHDIDAQGNVNGREDYLVATGDALAFTNPTFIYGFQIHPITGGDVNSSIKIDLDGETVGSDKYLYGDVDVRIGLPCPAEAICIRQFGEFTIQKRRP